MDGRVLSFLASTSTVVAFVLLTVHYMCLPAFHRHVDDAEFSAPRAAVVRLAATAAVRVPVGAVGHLATAAEPPPAQPRRVCLIATDSSRLVHAECTSEYATATAIHGAADRYPECSMVVDGRFSDQ